MKNKKEVLLWLSFAAVLISGYSSISNGNVLNLAGTQWMLIAIVLGIYSIALGEKKESN